MNQPYRLRIHLPSGPTVHSYADLGTAIYHTINIIMLAAGENHPANFKIVDVQNQKCMVSIQANPGIPMEETQFCAVCGCSDYDACEGGCHWVAPKLCSSCAEGEPA